MIYLSIVSIVEFILVILLGWIFCVQRIRERKLEDIANNCVQNLQSISSSRLKEAFSSDDEIGVFFRQLTAIQDILNNFKLDGQEEIRE